MKCNKCGAEFEGNFCPQCGAPAAQTGESHTVEQRQGESKTVAADGEMAKGGTFKAKAVAFERKILPFFGVIAAALCLIAGVIALAALAGPAIDYGELEEGAASGYDMLKWTDGAGYAISLLVIAALCVICGAAHLIICLRERKIRAAGYICGKVPLQALMSVLGALLLLGLAIAASAAIGWINRTFFAELGDLEELGVDAGGVGAAVLCPAIFGYIFFAACAFMLAWSVVRRYVPYEGRKTLGSLRIPKGEEYRGGISGQFAEDKKNIKVCKIVPKAAQWLTVLIFAASFAAFAAYIIWLAIILSSGNADDTILNFSAIPLFPLVPTALIALFYSRSGFCILSGKSPVRAVKGKRSMAICFAVGQLIGSIMLVNSVVVFASYEGAGSAVQLVFNIIFIILAAFNIFTAERQKRLFKYFASRGDFAGKKYSAYKNTALGENFEMLDKLYELLYYRKLEANYPDILNSLKQQ